MTNAELFKEVFGIDAEDIHFTTVGGFVEWSSKPADDTIVDKLQLDSGDEYVRGVLDGVRMQRNYTETIKTQNTPTFDHLCRQVLGDSAYHMLQSSNTAIAVFDGTDTEEEIK